MDDGSCSHAVRIMECSNPDLPEDIWRQIHTLLPMRDAARVACQSRSFLRSWRCHPNLTLNRITLGSDTNACPKNFICIIDRILKLVCYARTEMPGSMPNLETLVISSDYESVDTPMLPTKFMFLKYLCIYLITDWSFCPTYDYFSLASFLDASPSLETLILDVTQHRMKHKSVFSNSCQLRQITDHRHGCLKTVNIKGFSSAKGLIELTCYIVKNAESLECLTLDTLCGTNRCYLENSILKECDPMSEGILKEAPRAVKAIRTYIEDKVPSTVKLSVLEPCSRCHANGGFRLY
ncbi:hypothetical protein QOZ80_8BG0645870 [Eleusine coracana subsp. coracana]|nr:hypothetical protein QOZ80_8BG0645870 [Eleusine coracana subsp. coracana]